MVNLRTVFLETLPHPRIVTCCMSRVCLIRSSPIISVSCVWELLFTQNNSLWLHHCWDLISRKTQPKPTCHYFHTVFFSHAKARFQILTIGYHQNVCFFTTRQYASLEYESFHVLLSIQETLNWTFGTEALFISYHYQIKQVYSLVLNWCSLN